MQIIFFGFYVEVANLRKLYGRNLFQKIREFNENFYSVHLITLINAAGLV